MNVLRTTIHVGAPHPKERAAYELWRLPVPEAIGHSRTPWGFYNAMLHPWNDRAWHERYAQRHGFFWIPCPRCGVPFGGHEVGITVHLDTDRPGVNSSLCSPCSSAEAATEGTTTT